MRTRNDARSNVTDVARTMPVGERRFRSVTGKGTVTGLLAAGGVALWYLFRDAVAGYPLFTPRLLGQGLGGLFGIQSMSEGTTAALIGYTVFHVTAFVAIGIVAAAVVRLARRHATVLAGAMFAFVISQAMFWVGIGLLDQTTITGMLGWSQLAAGNIIGCAIMGVSLWRAHPELSDELGVAMSGTGTWSVEPHGRP